MNKRIISIILALVMIIGAFGIVPTAVQAVEAGYAATGETVISVTAEDIEYYGALYAIQQALDQARDNATENDPYTVTVPAGTYDLPYVLRMYSNTTLDVTGVTFVRTEGGNMLRTGTEDSENTGATGYDAYKNIKLIGGTFDGNYGENTIIKAFHTTNFTMEGVTLLHEKEGHMMEFAGVDGLTIRGCTFKDQQLTPGNYGYEAIQLDVLHPFHITNGRVEDLSCNNVLIEDCTFEDMPRGIGSHTAVHNNPHNNITIRNNTFKNMTSIAIQGHFWTNVTITGNYVDNAPRAITVYSEPGGNAYMPGLLSSKGSTTQHYSDSYQTPPKSNIEIAYNTLKNIGTDNDKYAYYASQAIGVLGEKLTSKSPKDNQDESGGLPAGDYYHDNVKIHDNYIDIRGNGVRVEDARNVSVEDNVIICSKHPKSNENYYGVVFRDNVTASSVSRNTIINASVNGLQLVDCTVTKINYNYIEGAGNRGIAGYTAIISELTDNDVVKAGGEGIFMNTSDTNKPSDVAKMKWNRVRNCGDDGIYFVSTCIGRLVESNTTVNSGSGIAYTHSAGLVNEKTNYTSSSSLSNFYLTGAYGVKMGVGTAYKLTPDVRPTNAFATFTYRSSDASVASVDKYGRISALKQGSAVITVTSGNGISKTYPVEVTATGAVSYLEPEQLATPQITGFENASNGIRIKWDAVSKAAGYRIYYKGRNGWTGMANTTSTSYVDTDVSLGHTYTYTLRTLDNAGNVNSGYNSTGWSYTYVLDMPVIKSYTNTDKGIRLSWDAVPGAYGYRVFYKGSKGWTRLGTTTSTSIDDNDVRSGSTYVYTVRCIDKNDNYVSDFDGAGFRATFVAPPVVTSVSSGNDGLVIKWNAVKGAYGYRVFYKGRNGWTRLGTTTDASFTDEDVNSGSTYTYTVRCIDANDNYISSFNSTGFKGTFIATPHITKIYSSNSGVVLNWNAVKGAYGYRVFYKGRNGWTRLGTTTGTGLTDTDVRNGSSYIYTVRCIDKNDNYISDFDRDGVKGTYYGSVDFELSSEHTGVGFKISVLNDESIIAYRIFYKGRNGWTRMATVSRDEALAGLFIDEDVRDGSSYTYTIRGVDENDDYVTGFLSSGKRVTYQKPAEDPTEFATGQYELPLLQ